MPSIAETKKAFAAGLRARGSSPLVELFRRQMNSCLLKTAMNKAVEKYRWVTIGGKSKDGGERSGGFPVELDADGNIIKSGGPQSLVGKHITDSADALWHERVETKKSPKRSREEELRDAENFARLGQKMTCAEIDRAAEETHGTPSDSQKEAGNYRKGKISLHGLDISIETPRGGIRKEGQQPIAHHYGYIRGTMGRDGDHVDCFIGPSPASELVFVVDQVTAGGRFDEHKVMMGFRTKEDAIKGYLANYPTGWKLGEVTPMTLDQFKAWLNSGDTMKPVNKQVSKYARDKMNGMVGDVLRFARVNWEESKHPRSDNGQFGQGSGSTEKTEPAKEATAPPPAPATGHFQSFRNNFFQRQLRELEAAQQQEQAQPLEEGTPPPEKSTRFADLRRDFFKKQLQEQLTARLVKSAEPVASEGESG